MGPSSIPTRCLTVGFTSGLLWICLQTSATRKHMFYLAGLFLVQISQKTSIHSYFQDYIIFVVYNVKVFPFGTLQVIAFFSLSCFLDLTPQTAPAWHTSMAW